MVVHCDKWNPINVFIHQYLCLMPNFLLNYLFLRIIHEISFDLPYDNSFMRFYAHPKEISRIEPSVGILFFRSSSHYMSPAMVINSMWVIPGWSLRNILSINYPKFNATSLRIKNIEIKWCFGLVIDDFLAEELSSLLVLASILDDRIIEFVFVEIGTMFGDADRRLNSICC